MLETAAFYALQWAAYQITYDGLWRRTENYVSNRIIDSAWSAVKCFFSEQKPTNAQLLDAFLENRLTAEQKTAKDFFLKHELYHITHETSASHNAYIAIAATITLLVSAYLFSLSLLPALLLTATTTALTSASYTQYITHAADAYAKENTDPAEAIAYFKNQKQTFYTTHRIKFLETKAESK